MGDTMKLINSFRNYILDEEFKINIFKDKVNVVNYTDIINFTSKEVTIKYNGGLLLIIGNNLSISRLLIDEVLVTGNIEKIELRWKYARGTII